MLKYVLITKEYALDWYEAVMAGAGATIFDHEMEVTC